MIDYKVLLATNFALVIRADNIDNPSKHLTCYVDLSEQYGDLIENVENYRILTDEMTYQITTDSNNKKVEFRVFYSYRG
jgi:hypothetical protein